MKNSVLKKWLLPVVALALLASHTPALAEPGIKKIEILEDGITIDGTKFDPNSTLADYQKVLGKADRIAKLMNTIYTFDDLGIYLFQKENKQVVYCVVIMFNDKPKMKFQPKKPFQAVLTIGGQPLGRDFSQAAIKGLKGVISKDEIGKYSSTLTSYGKGVSVLFDHSTKPAKLDLVSISWK